MVGQGQAVAPRGQTPRPPLPPPAHTDTPPAPAPQSPTQMPHLLALLDAQLATDLYALHGVGEEVVGGVLHLVLVEGAREVPAQEDDGVGQQLRAGGAGSALTAGGVPPPPVP